MLLNKKITKKQYYKHIKKIERTDFFFLISECIYNGGNGLIYKYKHIEKMPKIIDDNLQSIFILSKKIISILK